MGNEIRAKLRTMLDYWIKHNTEHSQEFRKWAEKARELGESETAGEMLKAAEEIDRAGESLSRGLKSLGRKEP